MNTEYKKCVVLDLDNTLWGGVIGEDGMEGIQLALTGPGAAFVAFQQALSDMKDRGVILAINSRNNPDDALAVIRTHPNMVLREKDFSAMRINWQDKVQNMKELAAELHLGLDAFVFLDDDAVNRAAVRSVLPQVEVPELPSDPAQYAKFLLSLPFFPQAAATDEDKMRSNLYVTERLRREEEKTHDNRDDFLKSLGIEVRVARDDQSALPRLSQMTGKTNQFNIHKQPLSEEAIAASMRDPHKTVFHASVTDRFGDSGIVAFALIQKNGAEWFLEQFLLSCRVIGRGVEDAFLADIARAAVAEGARMLRIDFVRSEKNAPAAEFVERVFGEGRTTDPRNVIAPHWITIVSQQ